MYSQLGVESVSPVPGVVNVLKPLESTFITATEGLKTSTEGSVSIVKASIPPSGEKLGSLSSMAGRSRIASSPVFRFHTTVLQSDPAGQPVNASLLPSGETAGKPNGEKALRNSTGLCTEPFEFIFHSPDPPR